MVKPKKMPQSPHMARGAREKKVDGEVHRDGFDSQQGDCERASKVGGSHKDDMQSRIAFLLATRTP